MHRQRIRRVRPHGSDAGEMSARRDAGSSSRAPRGDATRRVTQHTGKLLEDPTTLYVHEPLPQDIHTHGIPGFPLGHTQT
jgi:hypothetical protein